MSKYTARNDDDSIEPEDVPLKYYKSLLKLIQECKEQRKSRDLKIFVHKTPKYYKVEYRDISGHINPIFVYTYAYIDQATGIIYKGHSKNVGNIQTYA